MTTIYSESVSRYTYLLCGVLMLVSTNLQTFSQTHVSFDRYSVEHGLPDVTVNAIYQDHEGYMWFGTANGLCRFDGIEFTVYRPDPGDTNSISGEVIWDIYETGDDDGTGEVRWSLWVGTYGRGLNKFDRESGTFARFRHDPSNPHSLSNDYVKAIVRDRSGNLWIGTYGGGLNHFDPTTRKFVRYQNDPEDDASISDNTIRSLNIDSAGNLWIGTVNGGLNMLENGGTHFVHYTHNSKHPYSMPRGSTGPVHEDRSGALWVATSEGLSRFDRSTRLFASYRHTPAVTSTLSDNKVYAVTEDGAGSLWVATFNGLNRYEPATDSFTRFMNDPDDPVSLSQNQIRCMYRDRTGAIWVGTVDGGVNKLNTQKKKFGFITHDPSDPSGLQPGTVWSLCEDRDGALWVGTKDNGIGKREPGTGRFHHYRPGDTKANSLKNGPISSIFEDDAGTIWVGTWGAGLFTFDPKEDRFTAYRQDILGRVNIWVICSDRQGKLWIGSWDGLFMIDRTSAEVIHYRHNPEDRGSISHNRAISILEDSEGDLWVGTEGGGLNRLRRSTGVFERFRHTLQDSTSICNDNVTSIVSDSTGTLWIGTYNGLNRLDPHGRGFQHFGVKDGMETSNIQSLVFDDQEMLWIVTSSGLTRLNTSTMHFTNYDPDDGLNAFPFSGITLKDRHGRIYLGGARGITTFQPDEIKNSTLPPPIVITSFRIFEKPGPNEPLVLAQRRVNLRYNENFLSFTFAALDYTSPAKNKYLYKMEGLDQEWIDAGTRRYAPYPNLPPGDYVFKVKGSNSDEVWNDEGTSLALFISPPFWNTPWFRLVALGFLIAALVGIHNYRVAQLLAVERLRIRIASDLHDDIGSSLSSIALITDMVRSKLPHEIQERKHLADASIAARHTADSLKDIVWMLNPEHEKLDDIILRMKDAAQKLLIGMEYSVRCSNGETDIVLDMELRRHILLIYKEILNNIAKHSHATKVEIVVSKQSDELVLSVCDNGTGFDENAIVHGNGLNNLRRRASEIGGTIDIQSSRGGGTTVRLMARIP